MFVVNDDLSIYATRGDIVCLNVSATDDRSGEPYEFQPGDIVQMKVYVKKDAESVVLQKDFPVAAKTDTVGVFLTEADTKIGDVISKPTDYWYEVTLNPYTNPQTFIGYDEDGAKIFKLFPEGHDVESEDEDTKPEDIPVVDIDLDLLSSRPVQNKAIARALTLLKNDLYMVDKRLTGKIKENANSSSDIAAEIAVERARIDNLIASPAADDAELTDIRVGLFGEMYDTAGAAVRGEALKATRTKAELGYKWFSGYVDGEGNIISPAIERYYSDFILVNPSENVEYVAETNHTNVAGISFYDANHKRLSIHCNNGEMGAAQTVIADDTARYCRLSIKEGQQNTAYAVSETAPLSSAIVKAYADDTDFDREQSVKCSKLYRKLQAINFASGKVTAVGDSLTESDDYDEKIMAHFPNITLIDKGIGGNTTLSIIDRLDDIVATAPNLFLLAIGVNDNRYNDDRGAKSEAEYVANMTTIIDRLRSVADVVVVGIWRTHHNDQFAALGIDATRRRADRWNAALEQLCNSKEVLFINPNTDIDRVINLENEERFCIKNAAGYPDGVHTNDIGNQMRADAVLFGNIDPSKYDPTPFKASGKYSYMLEILESNEGSGYVVLNNIHATPSPIAGEYFTNSSNVNYRDLETMFNGGGDDYLGVANKAFDFPLYITWTSDKPLTSLVYSAKTEGRAIHHYNLYVSTDKRAAANPYHKSWRLLRDGNDHDPGYLRLF